MKKPGDWTKPREHKLLARAFDSAAEYAAYANAHADKHASSHTERSSFTKTESFEESALMSERDGWPQGRERVEGLTGRLVAELSGRIMREEWNADVTGEVLDVGRYCAGEPEHWLQSEEVHSEYGTSRRHVRILYNGTVSSGVSTQIIEARGAAMVALIDLLELAGDVVTLDVIYCVCDSHDTEQVQVRFPAKRADERADMNKLLYWLAHPSALRRTTFAYFESHPQDVRHRYNFTSGGGYGSCRCAPHIDENSFDVYFGAAYYGEDDRVNWLDIASCQRWLEKFMTGLGVRFSHPA